MPCSSAWEFGDEPHCVVMLGHSRVSWTVGRHYRTSAMPQNRPESKLSVRLRFTHHRSHAALFEICEWLHNYNNQAEALGRPHVTQFVVVDDRNLLSEEGGELLIGRFVRTDAHIGPRESTCSRWPLCSPIHFHHHEQPLHPWAARRSSEHRTSLVKHGEFGEVRLNMQSDPLPPTNGSTGRT